MFSSCPPVSCNHALEAPLAAENIFQKLAVLRSAVPIDCIVGGHDGPWLCLFYNDLETFQIDFTKCTLGNTGIAVLSVGLFVICCKMLYRSCNVLGLDTFYHSCAHLSGNQRILGIVLEVSSAKRISVDIYCWGKPYSKIVLLHFFGTSLSNLLNKSRVPGACKKCRARPCCCVHAAFPADTKSGWTVCCHNGWNAVIRKISKAEGIGNTYVWLSSKKMNQIVIA